MTAIGDDVSETISPDQWITWWKSADSVELRCGVLKFLPAIPNLEIEQILIDCLDSPDYRGYAARRLGDYRSYRSACYLRQILDDRSAGVQSWGKYEAIVSLGELRDEASVETLLRFAREHPRSDEGQTAVHCLGFIGTQEAERAICSLLGTDVDEQHIAGALICCGSPTAVAKAIEVAKSKPDEPGWLCKAMMWAFWGRGHRVGDYYTHVATAELASYLSSVESESDQKEGWDWVRAVEPIDSEEIRVLLRRWASRTGGADDPVIRENDQLRMSRVCFLELINRGDDAAIDYVLGQRTNDDDHIYVHMAERHFRSFPSDKVAHALRGRLSSDPDERNIARCIALLAQYGTSADAELIRPFLDHHDDRIANIACESLLRLTDPSLVPENWREI